MSERIEVYAEDEEDFVEKYFCTPRPCIIWTKPDFDKQKMNKLMENRGYFFMNTNIDGIQDTICLPMSEKKERE